VAWYLLGHVLYTIHSLTGYARVSERLLRELLLDRIRFGNAPVYTEYELERDLAVLESMRMVRRRGGFVELDIDRLGKLEDVLRDDPMLNNDRVYMLARLRRSIDEQLARILSGPLLSLDECVEGCMESCTNLDAPTREGCESYCEKLLGPSLGGLEDTLGW